jgi:N-acetylglutamate synthase-like GNAT family acetyltransferase
MKPTLRRATPADANLVRDLTWEAYAKWVPVIGRKPRPMTIDYKKAVTDHIIELCETDSGYVAVLEVVPHARYLLIENIAVLPNQQGKGIGTFLLKHAEHIARSLHLDELQLYTNEAFASNIAFYSRHGFQEFHQEPLDAGGVVVHMKKTISSVKSRQ